MKLFGSPGLPLKSGKPFCQRRKGFHLTEILFRVIDLKVLNSYSESEIQEPPAGLGFKITRLEWVSELWCIKQWGQLLFSPISQGMEEGKLLRIKKRNLWTVELLHLALLEAESQFAFSRETSVRNLINLLVTMNCLKGELEETKQIIEEENRTDQSLY